MRKLSSVLSDAIDRREVLRAARVQRLVRNWSAIVGEGLAQRSNPDHFDRGTLWVSVTGSAWAQELRMVTPQILEKIAKLSGDPNLVIDVRYGVRPPRQKVEGMETRYRRLPDPDLEHLSISEIKERRLRKWREEGTQS